MAHKQVATPNKLKKDLIIERSFNAPRELLWQAWTNPQIVRLWWGPRYFTAPYIKIDLRVGGSYFYCMRAPDGKNFWSTGTYREIVDPERLVITDSFANEMGEVVSAAYYGLSPDFPLESNITIHFEEVSRKKTKLKLTYHGVPVTDYDNAASGWNQSLDKLAAQLPDIDFAQI